MNVSHRLIDVYNHAQHFHLQRKIHGTVFYCRWKTVCLLQLRYFGEEELFRGHIISKTTSRSFLQCSNCKGHLLLNLKLGQALFLHCGSHIQKRRGGNPRTGGNMIVDVVTLPKGEQPNVQSGFIWGRVWKF